MNREYTCWNCCEVKAYHPSSCRHYLLPLYCRALLSSLSLGWPSHQSS